MKNLIIVLLSVLGTQVQSQTVDENFQLFLADSLSTDTIPEPLEKKIEKFLSLNFGDTFQHICQQNQCKSLGAQEYAIDDVILSFDPFGVLISKKSEIPWAESFEKVDIKQLVMLIEQKHGVNFFPSKTNWEIASEALSGIAGFHTDKQNDSKKSFYIEITDYTTACNSYHEHIRKHPELNLSFRYKNKELVNLEEKFSDVLKRFHCTQSQYFGAYCPYGKENQKFIIEQLGKTDQIRSIEFYSRELTDNPQKLLDTYPLLKEVEHKTYYVDGNEMLAKVKTGVNELCDYKCVVLSIPQFCVKAAYQVKHLDYLLKKKKITEQNEKLEKAYAPLSLPVDPNGFLK